MTSTGAGRVLAAALSLGTAIALSSGCTDDRPAPEAGGWSGPIDDRSSGPTSEDPRKPRSDKSIAVEVFYARGPSGGLISRKTRVRLRDSPILSALALAAVDPAGRGRAVVPANAFSHAGFDGIGADGSFSLRVTRADVASSRLGMTRDEAGLALRAALCTVQSVSGHHQRVEVYPPGGGDPVRRLFGLLLPAAVGNQLDVGCGQG